MKIKRVNELLNDPSMQEQQCNFKLTKRKSEPPQWFKEWSETTYQKQPPQWFKEFEVKLNARLDNLIKKNNLIE